MDFYGGLMDFYGGLMGFNGGLMDFYGGLMDFYGGLMGFNGGLMGFYGGLMGFYGGLMGFNGGLMEFYGGLMDFYGGFATLSCLFKLSDSEALSGADDCEFEFSGACSSPFHIKSRIKTRFFGECTTTGAEKKTQAWILGLFDSQKRPHGALK